MGTIAKSATTEADFTSQRKMNSTTLGNLAFRNALVPIYAENCCDSAKAG